MNPNTSMLARFAGALYLVIIVAGVWSQAAVREALFVSGDVAQTAENVLAAQGLYRLSFAADTLMVVSDVLLAAAMFVLLRPVSEALSLAAMVSRLTQAAILGMNLLTHYAVLLVLTGPTQLPAADLAYLLLDAQGHGYDIGLVFFGVNCLLTGVLLYRGPGFPRTLGVLIGGSGLVYLAGSFARFLAPGLSGAIAPAYLLPLVAESALCLWLLTRGLPSPRAATSPHTASA